MNTVPKLDPRMIARLIIALVAVINVVLGMFGLTLIPIDEDVINKVVSGGVLIVSVGWSIWKDNDISKKARKSKSSIK